VLTLFICFPERVYLEDTHLLAGPQSGPYAYPHNGGIGQLFHKKDNEILDVKVPHEYLLIGLNELAEAVLSAIVFLGKDFLCIYASYKRPQLLLGTSVCY